MLAEISAVKPIFDEVAESLEALKRATADKNKGAISGLSSEIVGKANLLISRILEICVEEPAAFAAAAGDAETSLESILAVLENRKRAVFLLIECFSYVLSSKRNILGAHIQKLIASIYDTANEGIHYLAKDAVFEKYSKIIEDTIEVVLPLFRHAGMKEAGFFFMDIFMPWIHGIPAPIRTAAKHYFRDELQYVSGHRIASVTFEAKTGGVQIGTRAIAHFADAHPPMTFHVKAHQNYAAMSSAVTSSQRKGIDLKELFVYKTLEYVGVAPKVYFITHQASDDRAFDKNAFFIATQEVTYTKSPRTTVAIGEGAEVVSVARGKEKIFHPIKALYTMEKGVKTGDAGFFSQFREELRTPAVTPLKLEATLIDIIARVFRLGDLNEDNFARISVTTAEGRTYEKWKLFDFTVPEKMEGRYVIGDEGSTTDGFITGNGALRHPTVFLQDAIMCRERSEKINVGNAVINTLEEGMRGAGHPEKYQMPLPAAIERAFEEVNRYMQDPIGEMTRAELLGVNTEAALRDLEDYKTSALQNFEHLRKGLRSRQEALAEGRYETPCYT